MNTRTTRLAGGFLLGTALGLSTLTVGAAASAYAPDIEPDCSYGPIGNTDKVCQIILNGEDAAAEAEQLTASVTIPAGVTKMQAVLIGGGGYGYGIHMNWGGYGGGAGQVETWTWGSENTPTTSELPLDLSVANMHPVVGHNPNALPTSIAAGGIDLVTAANGADGTQSGGGGNSGGGNPGFPAPTDYPKIGGGGGALTGAENQYGGNGFANWGVLLKDFQIDVTDTLWAGMSATLLEFENIGIGGDASQADPLNPDRLWNERGPGSGGIGLLANDDPSGGAAQQGVNGLIVIRYQLAMPALSLSATKVQQGGKLTITASELNSGETGILASVNATGGELGAATASTDGGVAKWNYTVPENLTPGTYTVTVTRAGEGEPRVLTTVFEVTALPTPDPPQPKPPTPDPPTPTPPAPTPPAPAPTPNPPAPAPQPAAPQPAAPQAVAASPVLAKTGSESNSSGAAGVALAGLLGGAALLLSRRTGATPRHHSDLDG